MKWLKYISGLFIFIIVSCKSPQLSQVEATQMEISSKNGIDSTLHLFLLEYKKDLDAQMNQVISSTPEDLTRGQPSSNLGNMMTDIVFQYYLNQKDTLDFAVLNIGGIRVPSISKGNLMIKDAYQLMPFENEIVQLKINGHLVKKFVEHFIKLGGWPTSHLEVILDAHQQIQHILINGNELILDKIYTLGTNDYIANGGDKCDFFIGETQYKSGKLLREAIIDSWTQQKGGIKVDNTKRIRYE